MTINELIDYDKYVNYLHDRQYYERKLLNKVYGSDTVREYERADIIITLLEPTNKIQKN